MNKFIRVQDVRKYYEGGKIKALDGVDLEVDQGEFLAIMGPSGSGKSTLLNLIGNLDQPDSGCIFVEDRHLDEIKDAASYRAQMVGFVFQLHNLIPNLTALENVLIPMYEVRMARKQKLERAKELLTKVGLDKRLNNSPPELSGGERQRVAIARALANNPKIILADEPTGNVDSKTGERVMELLTQIWLDDKTTIILVTHDEKVARWAKRCVHMLDGKIVKAHSS